MNLKYEEQAKGYTISKTIKHYETIVYNGIGRIQFNDNRKTI